MLTQRSPSHPSIPGALTWPCYMDKSIQKLHSSSSSNWDNQETWEPDMVNIWLIYGYIMIYTYIYIYIYNQDQPMIDQNPEPESIQNLGCRPDSWITSRGDDQHLHTQRIRGHRLRHWLPLPSCLMNMHRIQRIMFETCMMNHFNHHV